MTQPTATVRISMWSGPRNVSTALMYSFRQRSDTVVVDEPLYGYYLEVSGAEHPSAHEVMAKMDCDGERVVDWMVTGETRRPVLFFKNMAHHLSGLDLSRMEGLRHALLCRDPVEMLPSLAKVLSRLTLRDTGLVEQIAILEHELSAGRKPVVIDARRLLCNPEGVLRAVCRRLGIDFEPAMLAWPAGPKPEDGVWAPYWYENVHRSTGFAPYRPSASEFPPELEDLLAQCRPLYGRLAELAITG